MRNKGRTYKSESRTLGYKVPDKHREEIAERWKAILLEYSYMDGEIVPNPIPREIEKVTDNIWNCGEVFKMQLFKAHGRQIIKYFTSFDKALTARDTLKVIKFEN